MLQRYQEHVYNVPGCAKLLGNLVDGG